MIVENMFVVWKRDTIIALVTMSERPGAALLHIEACGDSLMTGMFG